MSDEEQKRKDEAQRRKTITAAGIGLGIGSAALAAALLYSKAGRKKPDDAGDRPPRTSTAPETPIQAGVESTD